MSRVDERWRNALLDVEIPKRMQNPRLCWHPQMKHETGSRMNLQTVHFMKLFITIRVARALIETASRDE